MALNEATDADEEQSHSDLQSYVCVSVELRGTVNILMSGYSFAFIT